jgi:hypothetical protein
MLALALVHGAAVAIMLILASMLLSLSRSL